MLENSANFLETIIGNNIHCTTQDDLNRFFITQFQSKIKSAVAKELGASETEVLGIDSRLDEFSQLIQSKIDELLIVNGLKCLAFSIAAIDIDDESGLREKYDQIGMQQIETVRGAQAQKVALDTLGINWAQQQSAEVLKTMAANPGSIAGQVGAGLGMGVAAANAFSEMANQMFNPNIAPNMAGTATVQNSAVHPASDNSISNASSTDPMERLSKLKKMLDSGLIEQSEYDAKKIEILSAL